MREIIYVTGNKYKLFAAKRIFESFNIKVINKIIDCPEIQADTIKEVAIYSSIYASNYLKSSVLKNDSGLEIRALNNFPSVYTRYVEETLSEDGILKLMLGIEDRYAYFLEVLAYTEYGKETVIFIAKTEGSIAYEKSGDYGWGYDKIFIPKGQIKPLACFNDDERYKFWDDSAYIKLGKYLTDKNN